MRIPVAVRLRPHRPSPRRGSRPPGARRDRRAPGPRRDGRGRRARSAGAGALPAPGPAAGTTTTRPGPATRQPTSPRSEKRLARERGVFVVRRRTCDGRSATGGAARQSRAGAAGTRHAHRGARVATRGAMCHRRRPAAGQHVHQRPRSEESDTQNQHRSYPWCAHGRRPFTTSEARGADAPAAARATTRRYPQQRTNT